MNLFIFNRGLRCHDNTTLIQMAKLTPHITMCFIFTEQVDKKKNLYFSNNAVEFMIESLKELSEEINKLGGKLYFFQGEIIDVLKKINHCVKILSIGSNYDYTPYARNRQELIMNFCSELNITFYTYEDHVLYPILTGKSNKADGNPYTVFTPYKNHVTKNLEIKPVDKYNTWNFKTWKELSSCKCLISIDEIDKFYTPNELANVRGGRSLGLKILSNIEDFSDYTEKKEYFTYKTTFLAAHNHFGTVSIREVYTAVSKLKRKSHGLINELIWRDFYYNLYYHYTHMLNGMTGGINKAFRPKYNNIKWINNKALFDKWCNGVTGIPICDAAMRQLNTTGFMPNRLRMIVANILTKLFLITWRWGEMYFAQKLKDYDPIQNSAGWGWTVTGIDPQQVFRIFSPKIQSKKFDPECQYIKTYVKELLDVPNKDIHNWEETYEKHLELGIKYVEPAINYKLAYKRATNEFIRVHHIKN